MKRQKKTVTYRKIEHFSSYLQRLIIDKESFELAETNFTKKIITNNGAIVFNEEGKQDNLMLQLISKVRIDAAGFEIKKDFNEKEGIKWFDLTERPPELLVAKVDVKSAYWETALKLGVVSEQTDLYLKKSFTDEKLMKQARLKALGSLATKKKFTLYEKGKSIDIKIDIRETKKTYMYVCHTVDKLMEFATENIPGAFYYYWDCVFVADKLSCEVVDMFKSRNYGNKTETTTIEVFAYGNKNYLISEVDNKMYLVPQEKAFLLNEK